MQEHKKSVQFASCVWPLLSFLVSTRILLWFSVLIFETNALLGQGNAQKERGMRLLLMLLRIWIEETRPIKASGM
jgi:hypothetical protein